MEGKRRRPGGQSLACLFQRTRMRVKRVEKRRMEGGRWGTGRAQGRGKRVERRGREQERELRTTEEVARRMSDPV